MKKNYTLLTLLFAIFSFGQDGSPASPYYNGMDWSLTGMALKNALSTKITNTHTNFLSYSEVWDATQVTDLDPNDPTNNNVLLIYGFSNNTCPTSSSDDKDHRTRNKFFKGGSTSCEWNREHVYAKSLGTPSLNAGGTSDAGEDAHHLRASDVDRNNDRASEKFAAGSGNSGDITSTTWYPGDEWKGDVARMMMYMYLRYPTQCLPINVGVGNPVSVDPDMIDLFLQWNAEDPVSQYEDNRNTYHGNIANPFAQGNRNPFIDNPYLATIIWGGPIAQNRWTFLDNKTFASNSISVYPNPSNTGNFTITSVEDLTRIAIYNINGQLIQEENNPSKIGDNYEITSLASGFYFLELSNNSAKQIKKIIVN